MNKNKENDNKIKCPYCDFYAKNYNGLCKHVFKHKMHPNITKEQLLTDVKYNGIRPTCKCGCGEYTTIVNTGGAHFADYVRGHWNRVHNNWGHNKKAQEKSANTRRKQYKNKERIQWNKGKKWDDVYSAEMQDKLRNNLITKIKERINNSEFNISSKLELEFIENFIKPNTENYKTQYYLEEIKQFCDIYIPDKNLIIEINGTFWHCDKRKYTNGPISKIQEDKILKDEIKYKYLKENNYNLLVIWEYDINNHPKQIKNLIKEYLK